MRILLTGFEPFGPHAVNPTAELVRAFNANPKSFTQSEARAVVLPVTFAEAFDALKREVVSFAPEVVLSFGLAGGRSDAIEIERVAINVIDADIPDNSGAQPRDLAIDPSGPAALFSTLPTRVLIERLRAAGVPARISNSAGTYVCNYLFYRLQRMTEMSTRRSGFIHLPYFPEQGAPAMERGRQEQALRIILETVTTA